MVMRLRGGPASRDGHFSTCHTPPLLLQTPAFTELVTGKMIPSLDFLLQRETMFAFNLLVSVKAGLEISSPFPMRGISGAQAAHDTEARVPAMAPHGGIPVPAVRTSGTVQLMCKKPVPAAPTWGFLTWLQR